MQQQQQQWLLYHVNVVHFLFLVAEVLVTGPQQLTNESEIYDVHTHTHANRTTTADTTTDRLGVLPARCLDGQLVCQHQASQPNELN